MWATFLCPSAKYLYCWLLPIFSAKYFYLTFYAEIFVKKRIQRYCGLTFLFVSLHYLVVIRELKRFSQYR